MRGIDGAGIRVAACTDPGIHTFGYGQKLRLHDIPALGSARARHIGFSAAD